MIYDCVQYEISDVNTFLVFVSARNERYCQRGTRKKDSSILEWSNKLLQIGKDFSKD